MNRNILAPSLLSREVPDFSWNIHRVTKTPFIFFNEVQLTERNLVIQKSLSVKEMRRIPIDAQDDLGFSGMVVYKQNIYVVNHKGLIVYCYSSECVLRHTYVHESDEGGAQSDVQGMCLVMCEAKAMLVVSDYDKQALVWIKIDEDFTMNAYCTQQLQYKPCGSYNDRGDIVICDHLNHRIHRYAGDGQMVNHWTWSHCLMTSCLYV